MDLLVSPVIPSIWLVVDGSAQMREPLSTSERASRWDALQDVLLNSQSGLVKELDSFARWGAVIAQADDGDSGACPSWTSVAPMLRNYTELDRLYTTQPLGASPAEDQALELVFKHISAPSSAGVDPTQGPTLVVLAVASVPDGVCSQAAPSEIAQRALEASKRIAAVGGKLYAISLSDEQLVSRHLSAVASAGGAREEAFSPRSVSELRDAFQSITNSARSCVFRLSGMILPGKECLGAIELNGMHLACNDDGGWHLLDPSTIELTGDVCEMYRQTPFAQVQASFPCDAIALN